MRSLIETKMARIITSVKIEFKLKEKESFYVVTTTHKDGQWEGGSTGAKIYPVDAYLVYTGWGSGKPLKVFKDVKEMTDYFEKTYACTVEVIK